MKFFTLDEFACKHCGQLPPGGMNPDLLKLLELARTRSTGAIYVTSGYRCPEHNANVGGVFNSYHVQGMAVDSWCMYKNIYEYKEILRQCMEELNLKGGLQEYPAQGFVHVDVRGYWAEW